MENIDIKIRGLNLYIITKSKTKIAINPPFNPIKPLELRGKRGIMAIMLCFYYKSALDNANRVGGNALAAARKAELFLRGGFYVYVFRFRAERFCYIFAHLLDVGGKLRSLRYYRGVYIGNGITVRCEYLAASFEYKNA